MRHNNLEICVTTEVYRLWVAVHRATAQGQHRRAATHFGLAKQAHSQIHYATGQQMSLEEAYTTILAPSSLATA